MLSVVFNCTLSTSPFCECNSSHTYDFIYCIKIHCLLGTTSSNLILVSRLIGKRCGTCGKLNLLFSPYLTLPILICLQNQLIRMSQQHEYVDILCDIIVDLIGCHQISTNFERQDEVDLARQASILHLNMYTAHKPSSQTRYRNAKDQVRNPFISQCF
jgi:hypothetical protein